MAPKQKTRKPKANGKNPGNIAVAKAIARHRDVLLASLAKLAESDECDDEIIAALSDTESDALKEVAESPCASDSEFIKKLKYLFAEEIRLHGGIGSPMAAGMIEDSSVLAALAMHFKMSV